MRLIRCDHCQKELPDASPALLRADFAFSFLGTPPEGVHVDTCGAECLIAWLATLPAYAAAALAAPRPR